MHASAVVPALLLNGSSGCATDHPVKYPGRGWASMRNIFIICEHDSSSQIIVFIQHKVYTRGHLRGVKASVQSKVAPRIG